MNSVNFSINVRGNLKGNFGPPEVCGKEMTFLPFLLNLLGETLSRKKALHWWFTLLNDLVVGEDKVEISHLQFSLE